jgi:predicted ATPase/class 3 adenylate cyclase
MEALGVYLPMDRWQALDADVTLPDRTQGAALFADVSGFTHLTETLVDHLGPQRGAEELTRYLNLVYDALITELHNYRGSVISFSGDAITCWFDGDTGRRAATCAFAMQSAMANFSALTVPSGQTVSLAMKVAVASGPARRFVVGDPNIQLMDVMAGKVFDQLALGERQARKGEVVLTPALVERLEGGAQVAEWREAVDENGERQRFGVVTALRQTSAPSPWPPLSPRAYSDFLVAPWLLPLVHERLASGQGEFLAELRPAVALFLRFGGIDYDGDESAGAKLDAYIRQVQRVLARYESYLLALTIGDKGCYFYAAFGAPVAHEDDAVRAASAALELRALPAEFMTSGVQIGVSQGRMRTGAYGGSMRRTYGVLGHEVNTAARLMQAAAPGQILFSKPTQLLTRGAFVWESLPDLMVKGRATPLGVAALDGVKERAVKRLQEARYNLPMVGRKAELTLVEQKLAQAAGGQGQVIGITAEAGMGKSRLVAEVIPVAAARSFAGYSGECESYGTNTSYLVWQTIWRDFFGLDPRLPLEDQTRALEAQLAQIDPALAQRAPLLEAVLNLPIPDNDLTSSFDAKLRKSSLESLLVECVRARSQTAPVLFVLEDCHWIDPLSDDLVEVLGRAAAALPVVLLMAYRPPDVQRSQAVRAARLPHFTEIRLTDFAPGEAGQLIRLKLEQLYSTARAISPAFVNLIIARAEGNPFYIEELINYLQDRDIDPQDEAALKHLDLPASLHSLILSRIDQLTERQKITIKVASVIGRLFKAVVLWGVYPQLGEWERVQHDLEALSRSELTVVDSEPELTYLFKHVVTQEVAYESLPYATRALLHEQIGQYLERNYADALGQYINLLAYHYDRSENRVKRREYLLKAGEAAQADYANAAALDYYQRVLPLVMDRERVIVLRKLGQVLELTSKWPEAEHCYQQALALAQQLDDHHAYAWCEASMGEILRKQGKYADSVAWLDRARDSFDTLDDRDGLAETVKYAGSLAAQQGHYDRAQALYEESLAIRRRVNDKPGIGGLLSNLGIVARFQGDYDRARALHEEGLAVRRELGDRWAVAVSLNNLGNVAVDQGDYAEARARIQEAVNLLREVGDRAALAISLNNLGNVARDQGDFPASAELYQESLRINRELGDRWALAYLLEDIGRLAAPQGQPERALRLAGAASALRDSIHAPLSSAEQAKLERALAPARQALSVEAQSAAWEAGRAMTAEQALDEALAEG